VRNLAADAAPDAELVTEKLFELSLVPVCSPRLIEAHGRSRRRKRSKACR